MIDISNIPQVFIDYIHDRLIERSDFFGAEMAVCDIISDFYLMGSDMFVDKYDCESFKWFCDKENLGIIKLTTYAISISDEAMDEKEE